MITDISSNYINPHTARDVFDVERSPLCKLVMLFKNDKEAKDFSEIYNTQAGLSGCTAEEMECSPVARVTSNEHISIVTIPNIKACELADTREMIDSFVEREILPAPQICKQAANNDSLNLSDIVSFGDDHESRSFATPYVDFTPGD